MEKREKWADEVIQSARHIERAQPDDILFDSIIAQLPLNKKVRFVSIRELRWAAVAACFVLGLNVFAFSSILKAKPTTKFETASDLRLSKEFILYK